MDERKLAPIEERFIQELELDRDAFLGLVRDGTTVRRRSAYFVVARVPVDLDQPVVTQINGLELSRNLRFGNHMVVLSNMLVLAQRLGMTRVFLPANSLFRTSFIVQGVRFTQSLPARHHNTLRGQFYNTRTFNGLLEDSFNRAKVFPRFRVAILPLSGKGALDAARVRSNLWLRSIVKRLSRELTIHIRSGDIFLMDNPHVGYWQPPLSYYAAVIEREGPRTVTLVFKNAANPVIIALAEWLRTRRIRTRLVQGPIETAICELATAQHVVGGNGSFLPPILAMSRSLAKITTFADKKYLFVPQLKDVVAAREAKTGLTTIPAGDYEELVSPWRNSPEQRDLMLRYELSSDQKAALQAE